MKDWSPSPMEKFPVHWMNSLTFWTSPDPGPSSRMMESNPAMITDLALRSLRKTSGLFDRDFSDFNLEEELSFVAQEDQQTINQSETLAGDLDLDLPNQSDWADLFGGKESDWMSSIGKLDSVGDCDLLSLPDATFDDLESGEVMEEFTDLSAAILGADAGPLAMETTEAQPELETISDEVFELPAPSEIPSTSHTTTGKSSRKRKVKRGQERDVEVTEPVPVVLANPDHDDYTLKVKKPRYSTASFAESDTESVADSLASSSSMSTSKYLSKEEKYNERRKKNNIASRRSRKTRKDKFIAMEDRAESLEKENEELKEKVELMESLAKALKQHLVSKLAK